jgi:hypothetical protein
MSTLSTDLRSKLERTCIAARNLADKAATAALEAMAVQHHEAYAHMSKEQKDLRNKLRAHGRQLGDPQDAKGQLSIKHLAQECAYEHWHRMLFARFLAGNNLLIEPELGVAVSLDEVKELAKEANTNLWALAGRYAQKMLPAVFRADDPVLQVALAREDQLKLEQLLDALPSDVFTASDSLGWCYQFWQTEQKDEVNKAGNKIGADELPAVTQLFTEDYMVDFLLDNTLGAWWAGKRLTAENAKNAEFKTEEDVRRFCSLPGVPWIYLRFIKTEDGNWTPAAGTFDGWPKTAKELRCLDPCMGSGHFVVAMFERLVALRMAEEKLDEKSAVASVIRDNLFGLEIDPRCTQIAAFNLALAAWRRIGHCALPTMNLACSGLAVNAKKEEWLKLAKADSRLLNALERLYQSFRHASVLGSLIDPRRYKRDLWAAEFREVQALLEKALARESANDDDFSEIGVAAKGLAHAAEMLAGQFALVATNVPYLAYGDHDPVLSAYLQEYYEAGSTDLATAFTQRCLEFGCDGAAVSIVTPQNWLYGNFLEDFRRELLTTIQFRLCCMLGPGAFSSISGEVVKPQLIVLELSSANKKGKEIFGLDLNGDKGSAAKVTKLLTAPLSSVSQDGLISAPGAIISFSPRNSGAILSDYVEYSNGIQSGDYPRFGRTFWEIALASSDWTFQQTTAENTGVIGGLHNLLFWEQGRGSFVNFVKERLGGENTASWIRGTDFVGQQGIAISPTGEIKAAMYWGSLFDDNTIVLLPKSKLHLPALLALCLSPDYGKAVRSLDKALKVRGALVKVPFDLTYWQKVAAQKYPHGLPKPFSSDPTQWLFNGQPKGSEQALQVAVARLLGYQWPRQTGSSFPDCPALGPDGLETFADVEGIVCIPSVRGEEPAAERLHKLLAAAYGNEWKDSTELELIRATGSKASDLDEWLRNEFFNSTATYSISALLSGTSGTGANGTGFTRW